MATADELRAELNAQLLRAVRQNRPHAEINAGELHRKVGGYPPKSAGKNTMRVCCDVMWQEYRRGSAEIVFQTESGMAPALTIKYYLPRP